MIVLNLRGRKFAMTSFFHNGDHWRLSVDMETWTLLVAPAERIELLRCGKDRPTVSGIVRMWLQ